MSTFPPEALPHLVTTLDESAEMGGWDQPPVLVRISAVDESGFDLGLRPLEDGLSVVDALAGFTAPEDWIALGVITEGNGRNLRDPRAGEVTRVRCIHLVNRDGLSASALRVQGHDVEVLTEGDQNAEGRIDDVCRRALGLSTTAPLRDTTELWAVLWLERTLAIDITEPVTWADVAALHAAVAMLPDEPFAPDYLPRLGEILADVHSWSTLRAACAAGEWPVDGVPGDVAGWLDDGAFSRWVMGTYPPIEALAAEVLLWLPTDIGARVLDTLTSWNLL